MKKLSLVLSLLLPACALAATYQIPEDRLPAAGTWESAGVPGGFRQYRPGGANERPVFAHDVVYYGADPSGVADSTAAFNAAKTACPANQVISIPSGTFKITGTISAPSYRTWRGAGRNATTLVFSGSAASFISSSGESPVTGPFVAVTGGATKGSTTLNVQEAVFVNISGAATRDGNVGIRLNGTTYNVPVLTGDNSTTIAAKIMAAPIPAAMTLVVNRGKNWIAMVPTDQSVVATLTTTEINGAPMFRQVLTSGQLAGLSQLNPDYVRINTTFYGSGMQDDGHGPTRMMYVLFKITHTVAGQVTLDHALPIDMTASPTLTPYRQYFSEGVGFEDMTIDGTSAGATALISPSQSSGWWWYNVAIINAPHRQIKLNHSVNFTIEHCYFSHQIGYPSHIGAGNEGVSLYQNCCWGLVQDNVFFQAGYTMLMLGEFGGCCVGNVIYANAFIDEKNANQTAPCAVSSNHGPHNMFNLWEANYAQNIHSDGYYGSDSHLTYIRNRFTGDYSEKFPDGVQYYSNDIVALCLAKWSHKSTLLGNILGNNGSHGERYPSTIYEASGGSYQNGLIYKIGFVNAGDRAGSGYWESLPTNPGHCDTNVAATLIREGNYDYVHSAQVFSGAPVDIPSSLWLSTKPSWWGSLAWPGIDPTNPAAVTLSSIPAGYRFEQGQEVPPEEPPALSVPSFTSHPANATITEAAGTTFSVGATGNPAPTLQWQVSINSGSTWANVAAGGTYSGSTTSILVVSGAVLAMNGYQFHCVATNSQGAATSNAATLTVTVGGEGQDTTPPTPNTIASALPRGFCGFVVTANEATDAGGHGVERRWIVTGPGGTNSGLVFQTAWTSAISYELLHPGILCGGTTYTIVQQSRDSLGNTSAESAPTTVRTDPVPAGPGHGVNARMGGFSQ